ncbi:unnamed protein product [Mucor hiemalis]
MGIIMWGWVRQRIAFKYRPAMWKKRYLVLASMSIHIHKSERGVISSLFPDNLPTVHVWSNYQSVKSDGGSRSSHAFIIEPRDPKSCALKFKCVNQEEKERWIRVIREQLNLNSQIWSFKTSTIAKQESIPVNYAPERRIMSVSVLDKWLDQLQITDTASLIKQQNKQKIDVINRSNTTTDARRGSLRMLIDNRIRK